MAKRTIPVVICMGSSCFSRGNNRTIEIVQEYARSGAVQIDARGHLCESQCKDGPNIIIDGRLYQHADAPTVAAALAQAVARVQEGA